MKLKVLALALIALGLASCSSVEPTAGAGWSSPMMCYNVCRGAEQWA